MTDYSNAGDVETEKVEEPNLVTIPSRGHTPVIEWDYPEFQCLCPVSQRHDQGIIHIIYQPAEKILESKSVREYLSAWRNKRIWQEYVTDELAVAFFKAAEPVWLILEIEWSPRGGITAFTRAEHGAMFEDDD
jgi:7-cyano-7-deazaguanine reductase